MIEYHLNILEDGGNKQKLIVVQSGQPIDERLLQIAGLLLDGGYGESSLIELEDVAAAFVSVTKAIEPHPWRPMTMRDGSKACADCYATPSDPVHSVQ